VGNVVVPQLGESIAEARVARWLKKVGDRVSAGEAVVELETEKVDLEVGSERAGVLSSIERAEGEDVAMGEVLAVVDESSADTTAEPPTAAKIAAPPEREPAVETAAPAAPVDPGAAASASEHGQEQDAPHEPAEVPAPRPSPAGRAAASAEVRPEPAELAAGGRIEERVRLSKRRQTIARRLLEAQRSAALLTTFNEIDMTAVVELRARTKESFKQRHGVGLGIVSFFVKASIDALRAYPEVNAEIQGDEMVLKRYYDIGVAVSTDAGLVVPVLRDADRMSFAEIETGIEAFGSRAAEGTLTLEDLRGGSFTITNGGVFGSMLSTPILNPPQVGILGLHTIQDRPVARGGQVVIRPVMFVALTYDHRLIDGREAVRFLVRIKECVEDPARLMLTS
jgi:2-oxoglutarate dehydrogenase E2 component (dihydrolipoamide succinyltransferase)